MGKYKLSVSTKIETQILEKTMNQANSSVCWIDGKFVPSQEAVVSVYDHGLLYGDGVFEGIRFYNRKIFLLEQHLVRLEYSARAIRLDIPYSSAELAAALQQSVEQSAHENGYIRLMVTRGKGPLGIDPSRCKKPSVIIITDQISLIDPEQRKNGAKVIIAATRRLPPDGLDPRIKSLNYLNHILAKWEAINAGADEAILLNRSGYVTEGTTDNIFIVSNGVLQTPPVSDGALAGITRQLIIDLARREKIPAEEKTLAPYDLYNADECFLTGTGAELIPVKTIDMRPMRICPGPIYSRLTSAFLRETTK